MSMASVAPIEMSAKVRNPAICPFRLRSMPMVAPNSRLSKSLMTALVRLTSGLMMSLYILSIMDL